MEGRGEERAGQVGVEGGAGDGRRGGGLPVMGGAYFKGVARSVEGRGEGGAGPPGWAGTDSEGAGPTR